MIVSSRTPEGLPHRCPVCGERSALEPSFPNGDSTCPRCGHLLWWFRDRLERTTGTPAGRIAWDSLFRDLGADSLDIAELILELEDVFEVTIPDAEAEKFKTVGDAIRYIQERIGASA